MTSFADAGGWPDIFARLFRREDLSAELAALALGEILEGNAEPAAIAAFLAGLRTKGETAEEMSGLMAAMRERDELFELGFDAIDTCGTGGDRSGTLNVSTLAALVVAGAGGKVCKHGGRAASSLTGSADVLEALGVVIELSPDGVRRCVEEAGIGFCFAPRYHPALRHAGPVRRTIGVATVFNFIAPLLNPAGVRRQTVGVGEAKMAEAMVRVLEDAGAVHAMVFFGHDGLDELSTVAPSTLYETRLVGDGTRSRTVHELDATSLGLRRANLSDLVGGDPATNAGIAGEVLSGVPGPHRDVVVLNAAAALVVAGLADDLSTGVELAGATLDSGAAAAALEQLVKTSAAAAAAGLV